MSQINWMGILQVKTNLNELEDKIGNQYWEYYQNEEVINANPYVNKTIGSLVTKICKKNNIARDKIRLHIINSDKINAFVLPDGHLIIYTGLILKTKNQAQLCGVVCHEIAHIELNHIMKRVVTNVGLSVLLSGAGGNQQIIEKMVNRLSSSAYGRKQEKAADLKAVEYMQNAETNPKALAVFLKMMSKQKSNLSLDWVNTHPNGLERANYITKEIKTIKNSYKDLITKTTWQKMLSIIKENTNSEQKQI